MSQTINILHLSDLHYTRSGLTFDHNIVFDALKNDLREFCIGALQPDVVILSGDLVNYADEKNIYYYLYDELLEDLTKITRCSESRIFLCPGNHDAQRSAIRERRDEQTLLVTDLTKREVLNAAYLYQVPLSETQVGDS